MKNRVVLGQIVGLHGLRGWLKVHSYTQPREQLLDYATLRFGDSERQPFAGQLSGQRVLVRPAESEDRTQAEAFLGCELWLRREEMPPAGDGEYYWCDLEGCRVTNLAGEDFGEVRRILATGAHDVLVVEGTRERLIPFVPERFIKSVDLEARQIQVDWEADY